MVAEFTFIFRRDDPSLQSWQKQCAVCGVQDHKMPWTIADCRAELRRRFCNVFDIVEAARNGGTAWDAESADELVIYSEMFGKMCPAKVAIGNNLLRYILRKTTEANKEAGNQLELCIISIGLEGEEMLQWSSGSKQAKTGWGWGYGD